MRLLHTQRAAGISGSERHLLALLPALAARGHDVHALVLERPGGELFTNALAKAGIAAFGVPVGVRGAKAVPALVASVRRLRPDVLHTHLIHADAAGVAASRVGRTRHVSSVHSTFVGYRTLPGRSMATVVGRTAVRTIAISEHVRHFLVRHGIVTAGRVRVVRYGIDLARWRPGDASKARLDVALHHDDVVLLLASRLVPHKGHDVALRAFASALQDLPLLRLVIAGDGPLRSELEQQARGLGVVDRVSFLGFVPDVPSLMRAADIVLFPTGEAFGEGFGMVNLEAMALARPVVGSHVASVPEIVRHGETGLLTTPGDDVEFAEALRRLASDAGLRRSMGEAARRRAEAMFSLDQMVDQTESVYREVLDD